MTAAVAPATFPGETVDKPLPVYLKDATIAPLPAVNARKTLLAVLCGRGDDAKLNSWIIDTTTRLNGIAHVVGFVDFATCMALPFLPNNSTRQVLSIVTTISGLWFTLYLAASLVVDVLVLVLQTFEFWFLFVINATTIGLWIDLLDDVRALGFAVVGLNFMMTMCFDANVYTRRLLTRITVLASPGLVLVLAATSFHRARDIQYYQYTVLGLTVDAADIIVTGNSIIAYFTAVRVWRSRHLLFSTTAIERVDCAMYFPTCHLVHQATNRYYSSIAPTTTDVSTALELVQHPSSRGIDVTRTLLPQLSRSPLRPRALMTLGLVGGLATMAGFAWLAVDMERDRSTLPTASGLESLSFATSFVFVAVYVAHFQPVLARRILREIDAWFVLFHLLAVTLGASAAFEWAVRPVFLFLSATLWCLWILFLDAVPPATRRRLGCSRRFVVLSGVWLSNVPALLAYWLYFADHAFVRDRVLVQVHVGHTVMESNLLGLMASKLGTLWVWNGRLLWREVWRPADAFKLIKRHVFYRCSN